MKDKPTHEFKIRLDDGEVDQEEAQTPISKSDPDQKVKKRASQRNVPIVFILLLILVAAAMAGGYLDIRNRLLSVHSTGSQETRHLSEDLQAKFSSLSIKFSALEESVSKLTETQSVLNQSLTELSETMDKATASISSLNAAKADKKSTNASLKSIEGQLAPLAKSAKNAASTASDLSTGLKELTAASAKTSTELKALQLLAEAIQADKASKQELLTEIDHVENVLKTSLGHSEQKRIELEQSIGRLERKISALGSVTDVPNSAGDQSAASLQDAVTSGDTPSGATQPQPGDLIERDISQ